MSYKDVGNNAQPEVRQAIARFKKEGKSGVLLYWLLGSGTPPYKMGKGDAKYTDKANGKDKCVNCEFAYSKSYREAKNLKSRHICSQISGPIALEGWCRLYKKGKLL